MPSLRVAIDSGGAVSGLNALKTAVVPVTAALTGFVTAITAGVVVLKVFGKAAFDESKRMVAVAAAAEEIRSKFGVVFRDQAPQVEKNLNAVASAAGRAKIDLVDMAAGVQDILVPMGLAREAATELSTAIVRLAVDVGSFQNKSDTDVGGRFQSALVGNPEAVKELGISMTQAAIKAEALRLENLGLAGGLTEINKLIARGSLLFRNTADAQNDAERTADSYENTMKRLEGTLKNIRELHGKGVAEALRTAIVETIGLDRVTAALNITLSRLGVTAEEAIGKVAELLARAAGKAGPAFEAEVLSAKIERGIASGAIGTESTPLGGPSQARNLAKSTADILSFPGLSETRRIEELLKLQRTVDSIITGNRMVELQQQLNEVGVTMREFAASGVSTPSEALSVFADEFVKVNQRRADEMIASVIAIQGQSPEAAETDTQRSTRIRDEADSFARSNRLLVTGAESALGGFSNAIGSVAAGFQSLEEAGRGALQGIIFDLSRAAAEALLFSSIIGPILSSVPGGGGSFADLFGQGLGFGPRTPTGSSTFGSSTRQQ